ncbi:MAG: phosphatidylinositol kinase, partial [Actinomycetota bacterium]
VEVNESIDIIELGQSNLRSIRNIALLDVIVNNTDRKFGHLLPVSESEVYGCDHGVTFHEEFKLRTVIWQFAGQALNASERNQIELVRNFVEKDQSFHSLLTAEEITATLERIEKLKNEGFPVPTEEWPAIPWPPV